MWNWQADSASELRARLAEPVLVPPRGQGRTKDHTENWTLRNLLITLAALPLLDYPIEPRRGDRPDLVLGTAAGKIGIEVTEIMPEEYARAEVIRDHEFPDTPLDPSQFRPGKAPPSAAGIRELLRASHGRLRGPGWSGDAVEQEWAEAVAAAIEDKEIKLNDPTFGRQPRNWLAIYDNLPTAGLNLDQGLQKLVGLPRLRPVPSVRFDMVTIESAETLVLLDPPGVQKIKLVR